MAPSRLRVAEHSVRLVDGGHPGGVRGVTVGVVAAGKRAICSLDDDQVGGWIDLEHGVRVGHSADPWGIREPVQGRDPQRTPMQWDASPNAGFCPPEVDPWLPLAPDASTVNVARQRDDPDSMLSLTRRLLRIRCEHPALAHGGIELLDGMPEGTLVFRRASEERSVLVALNLTDAPRSLLSPNTGRVLVGTDHARDGAPAGQSLRLGPNEGIAVELD